MTPTRRELERRLRALLAVPVPTTTRVVIGRAVLASVPELLHDMGLPARALVVADPNTYQAAGRAVTELLSPTAEALVIDPDTVSDAHAATVRDALDRLGSATPLAAGAGTVNDIVKLAAEGAGAPYVSVATAPSMNGYPSPIAAVLRHGLKCTVPAAPPVAIVYDTDVVATAPQTMIGSGYADLLAKPCSQADWILARELAGDPFAEEPLRIIDGVVEAVVDAGPAVAAADPEAVELLCVGLTLSGLSMAVAGSSQPASGSEHLISHFWDVIGHRDGRELDLHGRQVGLGCLVVSSLLERLLALDSADIVPAQQPCDAASLEPAVRDVYGSLADAAMAEFAAKSPDISAVHDRVALARRAWPRLRDEMRDCAVTAATMREHLLRGGAPTTLAEVGRTREEALTAVMWARAMRSRYTCLDLAAEIGALDEWAEDIISAVL